MTETSGPIKHASSDSNERQTVAGNDLLPPVEPPSAGFIVQLFVVPALIVLIVVSVWVAFSWLVHRATMRPDDLVDGLQGRGVARWQRASELADMLRSERFPEFRNSSAAAAKLAAILDQEIDAASSSGGMDEQSVTLRYFLCRALGEFRVVEGTDSLVKAATTNRDPVEQMVRRGAIQAIAIRAFNLNHLHPPQPLTDAALGPTFFQLSFDSDELIRSETAYAFGQIGTPESLAQLEQMVDDPYVDARYNAAVALAQHGNVKSIATLAEMLDPEELASVEQEENESAQFFKRSIIMSNAMDAVDELARQRSGADFSKVMDELERIVHADSAELERARIRSSVVTRARETLTALRALKN